jgi:anti-sigma B factor antagonist
MKNISVTTSAHPFNKEITLLSVKGFIDTSTVSEFDRAFQTVLGNKKFKLIVDLKEVDYISSAGWGVFVGEIKRIRSQQGNLFLASMSPEVVEAYELLEFDTIIKSFPDVEQAVQQGFGLSRPNPGTGKKPVKAPAETVRLEGEPEAVFEGPRVVQKPYKPRWVANLLKPWKWF